MCCLMILVQSVVHSWGFYGHAKINEIAIYTLPKPLFKFYKLNATYIVEHSADADKRRYISEDEACRHYLDGDFYEKRIPIDTIPKFYSKAIEQYGEDTVKAHGIVPWHIMVVMSRLKEAFRQKNIRQILKLSADLGHYVGDCHVPLHATSNYNGQKTAQKGIHALWESRLPELYFEEYDLFTGLAKYEKQPMTTIWQAYETSFSLVDSVLATERLVSDGFPSDAKYAWEQKGGTLKKVYSRAFCQAYHKALGEMVENRLRSSIVVLGSLWYTCWIEAGQPDLSEMPKESDNEDMPVLPEKAVMKGREEE